MSWSLSNDREICKKSLQMLFSFNYAFIGTIDYTILLCIVNLGIKYLLAVKLKTTPKHLHKSSSTIQFNVIQDIMEYYSCNT